MNQSVTVLWEPGWNLQTLFAHLVITTVIAASLINFNAKPVLAIELIFLTVDAQTDFTMMD